MLHGGWKQINRIAKQQISTCSPPSIRNRMSSFQVAHVPPMSPPPHHLRDKHYSKILCLLLLFFFVILSHRFASFNIMLFWFCIFLSPPPHLFILVLCIFKLYKWNSELYVNWIILQRLFFCLVLCSGVSAILLCSYYVRNFITFTAVFIA